MTFTTAIAAPPAPGKGPAPLLIVLAVVAGVGALGALGFGAYKLGWIGGASSAPEL